MKTTLVFLIDSWSSLAGGIQTVNREICLALASLVNDPFSGERPRIVCVCRQCTPAEQTEAHGRGVSLVPADAVEWDSSLESLEGDRVLTKLSHSSFSQLQDTVACVVGHSKFTGKAARSVRDQHFPGAKVVTFYHMDPDETEALKSASSESERRTALEREIHSRADVVFAVGPVLCESLREVLADRTTGSPQIHEILCGIRAEASVRPEPPERPVFLFVGRVDQQLVKGVDLFAKAAGVLIKKWQESRQTVSPEPKFVIRGLPPDRMKAQAILARLKNESQEIAGRAVTMVGRTFTTDESDLRNDILGATAVVMPSRAEGYGLVALEAISHGVPAIVAQHSGVAEVIKGTVPPGTILRFIVDTRDLGDEGVECLASAMDHFIELPARSALHGSWQRKILLERCSWKAAARRFLEVVAGDVPEARGLASYSENDIRALLRSEIGYVNDECHRSCGRSIESIFVERDFAPCNPLGWEETEPDDQTQESLAGPDSSRGVTEKVKWSHVVADLGSAVILGDPGAGKTVHLLREVEQRCRAALSSTDVTNADLALYLHASQLAGLMDASGNSVGDAAISLVVKRHNVNSKSVIAWLREKLGHGAVLLAIDAVDEVTSGVDERRTADQRSMLFERLRSTSRQDKPHPFIVTSRLSEYTRSVLPAAMEWRLMPLTRLQLRGAIRKWLADHAEAAEIFERMVLHSPPLEDLLTNPMVVMLACRVVEMALIRGESLPTFARRCDLYGLSFGYLRRRWIERAGLRASTPTQAEQEGFRPFAESVAWELWRRDPSRSVFLGNEIADVIEQVPKSAALASRPGLFEDLCDSGLLTKAGPPESDSPYLFLHRTFLEFLAASCVARKAADPLVRLDPVNEVRTYFGKQNARNILWMLAGRLTEPQPLVRAILSWADHELEKAREDTAVAESSTLAESLVDILFECVSGTIDRGTREQSWELVTRGLDRRQRARRKGGGEWADLQDWSFVFRALRAVAAHEDPASYAIDTLEMVEVIRRGQLLSGGELSPDVLPKLGDRPRNALRSSCPVIRWTAVWGTMALLSKKRDEILTGVGDLIQELAQTDSSSHVRSAAVRAIAEMRGRTAEPFLASVLNGPDPFAAAAAAIGLGRVGGSKATETLKRKADQLLKSAIVGRREPLLVAVIGALETAVAIASKTSGAAPLHTDEELAGIFLRALHNPLPVTSGTAASGLGRMRWSQAWSPLRQLAESPVDGAWDVDRMRDSIYVACDKLTEVISGDELREAEALFRSRLGDRRERINIRRPASSGCVKLLKRGYRSTDLTSLLLYTTRDRDATIAKNSMMALMELAPEEIIEDLYLLLRSMSPVQRQLACVATAARWTETDFLVKRWMLDNESSPDVLASALFSLAEGCERVTRTGTGMPVFLTALAGLDSLTRRSLDLSHHTDPNTVAGALNVLWRLARLDPFQSGGALFEARKEMLDRARALIENESLSVQAATCYAIAALGDATDLERLQILRGQAKNRKVKGAADGAYSFLRRRIGRS